MLYSQPSTWKRCGRSQPSMVSQSWSPTLPRNMYLVMMMVIVIVMMMIVIIRIVMMIMMIVIMIMIVQ